MIIFKILCFFIWKPIEVAIRIAALAIDLAIGIAVSGIAIAGAAIYDLFVTCPLIIYKVSKRIINKIKSLIRRERQEINIPNNNIVLPDLNNVVVIPSLSINTNQNIDQEIDTDVNKMWGTFSSLFNIDVNDEKEKEKCKQFLKNIAKSKNITDTIFSIGTRANNRKDIHDRIINDLFIGILHMTIINTDHIHDKLANDSEMVIKLFFNLYKDEINSYSDEKLSNLSIEDYGRLYQRTIDEFNIYYRKQDTTKEPSVYIQEYLDNIKEKQNILTNLQSNLQQSSKLSSEDFALSKSFIKASSSNFSNNIELSNINNSSSNLIQSLHNSTQTRII